MPPGAGGITRHVVDILDSGAAGTGLAWRRGTVSPRSQVIPASRLPGPAGDPTGYLLSCVISAPAGITAGRGLAAHAGTKVLARPQARQKAPSAFSAEPQLSHTADMSQPLSRLGSPEGSFYPFSDLLAAEWAGP